MLPLPRINISGRKSVGRTNRQSKPMTQQGLQDALLEALNSSLSELLESRGSDSTTSESKSERNIKLVSKDAESHSIHDILQLEGRARTNGWSCLKRGSYAATQPECGKLF